MNRTVRLTVDVNGVTHQRQIEARVTLADFLRDDLGLTGTHLGCEHGVCGACTILLEGRAVRSCLLFAVQADQKAVTTVEGLEVNGQMHPLQDAFYRHYALQCGFCTPGLLMTAVDFLSVAEDPNEAEIREAISGNICRCTGYQNLVDAIREVSETGRPGGALGNDRSI